MDTKTILIAIVLITVIGGSWVLYNGLKDSVPAAELPNVQAELPKQSKQSKQPEQSEQPIASEPASDTENQSADEEKDARIKSPDFAVTDADGNSVKLSDLLGKPVVLNYWASWCPPCKAEMPEFNKVYEELGDDVHFMMVDAVDGFRETKEKGEEYISGQGFTFPVYYDLEREAVMAYGIRAFPTTIFIDSEGYVITGVEAPINEAMLRKGIELIGVSASMAEYRKISTEEAKSLMDGGEPFILLDVRTEEEYNEKHIDGALLLPDYELAERAEAELTDKDALILVYCRTGRRSAEASKTLVEMGYTNVYDFGGIVDWPYDTAD